jgi:secreted trypsin-like serine protease
MKRLVQILLLSLISTLLLPTAAFAVKDGESAARHPRIVALYFKSNPSWPNAIQSCTGFLYSPRIVFTAAHCVHDGTRMSEMILLRPNQMWVGVPGARTGPLAPKATVEKIFAKPGYRFYNSNGDYSYTNDFAVLVLEKPLRNVVPAKLASGEFLKKITRKSKKVTTGGYGHISAKDAAADPAFRSIFPSKAAFKLIPTELGLKSVRERMAMWNRNYYQSDGVSFMRYEPGTAHPCNGDSGSGFFLERKGTPIYLGVTWPAVHPLCERGDAANEMRFKPPSGYVVAFRGIYMDLDVVNRARDYVLNDR